MHSLDSLEREQKVNWDQKGDGKYSQFYYTSIKLSDWSCCIDFLLIKHEGYNFQTCPLI